MWFGEDKSKYDKNCLNMYKICEKIDFSYILKRPYFGTGMWFFQSVKYDFFDHGFR